MRSHLLTGKVRHRRSRPAVYALEHDVFYVALDLDELDDVVAGSRLIRRNRRGVLELRDADHLPRPSADLERDVRALLATEGEERADVGQWTITMITNLRTLGYVFNPASFFLCRDASGTLRRVLVEVHNTFGERHRYPLAPLGAGSAFQAGMEKEFFVSPFISVDGSYAVTVRDDPAGLRIAIALRQDGQLLLATSLVLERRPLTDGNVLRLLLRHPLMPQRTIGLIHWHALRLWLRRVPFIRHGAKPASVAPR
jgi:DUF1365 family protein